jgi:hypothetical protein
LDCIPQILRTEEVFDEELEPDSVASIKRAERVIADVVRESRGAVDGPGVLGFMNAALEGRGRGWQREFWADVRTVTETPMPYAREVLTRSVASLTDPEYDGLSECEKVGLFYFWHCFSSVDLAINHGRMYLQNVVRSPLADIVYSAMARDVPLCPALKGYPIDVRGLVLENMLYKAAAESWTGAVPTLLVAVLERAKCQAERVPDAIIDLRLSRGARAFRTHFRQIRQCNSNVEQLRSLDADMRRLFELWASISTLGREPAKIVKPFLAGGVKEWAEWLTVVGKIPFLLARFSHLRMFWETLLFKKTAGLDRLIARTFPAP